MYSTKERKETSKTVSQSTTSPLTLPKSEESSTSLMTRTKVLKSIHFGTIVTKNLKKDSYGVVSPMSVVIKDVSHYK